MVRQLFRFKSDIVRRRSTQFPSVVEALEIRIVPAKVNVPIGSIIVTPAPDFFTTEAGGTTQFTVKLSDAPIAKNAKKDVTITVPISSDNTSEGRVNVSQITFHLADGQSTKTVTLTGVNDNAIDGDKPYKIVLGKLKTKNAKNYKNSINPADLITINKDDDQLDPGVLISPTELIVNDASSQFISVRLASRPTANVQVLLNVTEGSDQGQISTGELIFTPTNWNVVQKFAVGMYLEGLHDGDRPFEISVDFASADTDYDELPTEFISIINQDIDPLEFSIPGGYVGTYHTETVIDGLIVPIEGEVALSLADGIVAVTSPALGQGTYSGEDISFTVNAGATFTGHFTENSDGSVTASGIWVLLQNGAPSATGNWSVSGPFQVQPDIIIDPIDDLFVEEGSQTQLEFSLATQPTDDVVINFVFSQGTGEATLSANSLTFTPSNWDVPQILTVTGVDDGLDDGDQDFVFFARPDSLDFGYATVLPKSITVSVENPTGQVLNLEGQYDGTYEGVGSFLGGPETPVSGPVSFAINGAVVNVTAPAEGVGSVTSGRIKFATTSGPTSGATFDVVSTVENPDGSITVTGTWDLSQGGFLGHGTWTATRPALL